MCAISQRLSIPYQFLENRSEQSCMQFSGLRSWERPPAWIPFSDSLQWPYLNVIYSVMPLLLRIWNAFWPLKDYLLGIVFAQGFFYCLKLPCMKIYKHEFLQIKHPCFTRHLGPLHPSHQLQSPSPDLQRPWPCSGGGKIDLSRKYIEKYFQEAWRIRSCRKMYKEQLLVL